MTGTCQLRRRLEGVDSEKPQLVKTARLLERIDRVALSDDEYREFQGVDGRRVTAVLESSDYRAVWNEIMDVMSVIAPVKETNSSSDDAVMIEAVAAGSRRELQVKYCADGSLRVKALWSASATVSHAMVLVDETYSL
ncbi:hypothetical protein [Natrinema sp. DC36]|uniref:hypothetical protein n=1 Tax=Natrinema sp. DC36 TaxID=2878680 RepID=UPI001CF0BF4C|nr:hypothetical protein [Natrinema sp. DC36]